MKNIKIQPQPIPIHLNNGELGKGHHLFRKRIENKEKRQVVVYKKCPIFQGHSGWCTTSQAIEGSLFYNP